MPLGNIAGGLWLGGGPVPNGGGGCIGGRFGGKTGGKFAAGGFGTVCGTMGAVVVSWGSFVSGAIDGGIVLAGGLLSGGRTGALVGDAALGIA